MNPSPYAYPGMKGIIVPSYVRLLKVEEVFVRVCRKFDVTEKQLKSPTRQHRVAEARHVMMYFLMVELRIGCVEIGDIFNRDHSSVIYARNRIAHYIEKFSEYRDLIKEIKYDCNLIVGGLAAQEKAPEPKPFIRPKGEYSNTGFISVSKKYAS